ncbi:Irregular chiasm C-roughest protein, partial [Fasciolopsis buskii]
PSEAPKLIQITKDGKGAEVEVGASTPAIVDDGALLVLKCVARHGKPGALLTWLIDGVPVTLEPGGDGPNGTFRSGFVGNLTAQVTSSPKFPRLMDATSQMSARLNKLHHGKLIECRAENVGYESHALRPAYTKLEVHYAPVVSIQIRPQRRNNEYMEHDVITVECTAHGRPDSFFWEWFVNGRQVENLVDPWYRLRLTRNMHNAIFRCIAISNKKGHAELTVRVKFGPQFQEPSALLFTASPGEDVAMACPARGNPEPRIDWRRESGHEVLHRGVTYRKDNLREEDFGTYVCTAYVQDFPPISKQMYIAKRRPPIIQPNPLVPARLGRPARLRCTVNSVPLPPMGQTHWFYNGRPIRPDSHHTFEREEFIGGVVLILHIAHVMMTDYGKYNCTVQNGYGVDWKLIELVHQEDIPLQFIIGTAVALGILIVVGLILLCVCRQRICGRKYKKGRPTSVQSIPVSKSTQPSLQDYGVVNTEFKVPGNVHDGTQRQAYYPWFTNNAHVQGTYVRCGSDMDEQRSMHNSSKMGQEKCYFDESKGDVCSNSAFPVGISSAYCPTISSSCQLIQPLCNGGGYISAIDPRLLNSSQSAFLTGCPTILSTANMVAQAPPDFLPDAINLEACGSFDPMTGSCLFTTTQSPADGLPQITTLDLTHGIPAQIRESSYIGDTGSGHSSLDPSQTGLNNSPRNKLIHGIPDSNDSALSPTHSGSMQDSLTLRNSALPNESITMDVDSGITYVMNEHTTNV